MASFDLQDLLSSDWRVRRRAIEQLAQADASTLVDGLLTIVRQHQHDPAALNAALQVLSVCGVQVLPGLVAMLDDPVPETRMYAAQALGELRTPEAGPPLLAALSDPDVNVRYHVIEALGKVGYRPAIPALLEVLRTGDFYLAFPAIAALQAMPARQAVPALLDGLEDEVLGSAAAEALGDCGDLSVVPALVAWLEREHSDLLAVAQALYALYRRYQHEMDSGDLVGEKAVSAMGPRAWEMLIRAMREAPEHLTRYGRAIGGLAHWARWAFRFAGPAYASHLRAIARSLIPWLRRPVTRPAATQALAAYREAVTDLLEVLPELDREARLAVLPLLGSLEDARAVQALIDLLREPDADLAAQAAQVLGRLGARSAIDALLDAFHHPSSRVRLAALAAVNSLGHPQHTERVLPLLSDPQPQAREMAVRSLGYFGDPRVLDAVLDRWDDPDPAVRRAVLDVAPFLETPRALEVLVEGLRASDPALRTAAVRGLAYLPPEQALTHLEAAAHQEQDPWVRVFVVRALGRLGDPAALPPLIRLTSDPFPPVRAEAARALVQVDGARVVPLLREMVHDPVPDVARAALQALAQTHSPAGVAALEQVLREEARPELQRAALEALAVLERPEAVALLRTAVAIPNLRAGALAALGRSPLPEAAEALVECLLHQPEELEPVLQALDAAPPSHAAQALFRAWQRTDLLEAQRRRLVYAMRRLQLPQTTEALLAALQDPAPSVRLAALQALFDLGAFAAWPSMAQLAQSDPDPEVRETARRLLGLLES